MPTPPHLSAPGSHPLKDLLQGSPLWRERPEAERRAWWQRCLPLLQIDNSPAPLDGAVEARVDLADLARAVEGLDLSALPGVPASAVAPRQLARFAGRLCAEAALAAQGHRLAEAIGQDAAGGPAWPPGWTGAIAHGGGVALAAVLRPQTGQTLGVDTEARIDTASTQRAVLKHCVHPSERALVLVPAPGDLTAADTPRSDRLTLVFAAKEAYYKAVRARVGRMVDFQEMALAGLDEAACRFHLAPVAGPASGLPSGLGGWQWAGPRLVVRVRVRVDG